MKRAGVVAAAVLVRAASVLGTAPRVVVLGTVVIGPAGSAAIPAAVLVACSAASCEVTGAGAAAESDRQPATSAAVTHTTAASTGMIDRISTMRVSWFTVHKTRHKVWRSASISAR